MTLSLVSGFKEPKASLLLQQPYGIIAQLKLHQLRSPNSCLASCQLSLSPLSLSVLFDLLPFFLLSSKSYLPRANCPLPHPFCCSDSSIISACHGVLPPPSLASSWLQPFLYLLPSLWFLTLFTPPLALQKDTFIPAAKFLLISTSQQHFFFHQVNVFAVQ